MSKPFVYEEETIGFPPDKNNIEAVVRKVADRIIQDTDFLFENTATGETFRESEQLPVSDVIRLKSGYNDWKYWNGIINMAMVLLSETLNEPRYKDYAIDNYAFGFQHLDYFKQLFDARIKNANFHQYFRMDRLDDCSATGAGLIEAYKYSEDPDFLARINQTADHIMNKQDRLADGTFIRIRFDKTTLWADDLYMSVPFLARMANFTGDNKYFEEAIRQVKLFNEKLYAPEKGLFHHCWHKELNQHGVAFWGRANGWIMMAQAELLSFLPGDYPQRQELIELLFRQIVNAARYQGSTGLWHQLMDKTDSFPESSSTSMFVYSIAKAVNNGWIDDIYASIAVSGWEALADCVKDNGDLDRVSSGFNLRQHLPFYYNRHIEEKGVHGEGAFLLAANEMYKMKQFRECVWC